MPINMLIYCLCTYEGPSKQLLESVYDPLNLIMYVLKCRSTPCGAFLETVGYGQGV